MLLPNREAAEWLGIIASIVLIALIYVMQAHILYKICDDRWARSAYALVILATVPVCWAVSPYWPSPQNHPIATFLGWPVMVNFIPLLSFHRGLELRQSDGLKRWWREVALQLVIGMPIWFVVWTVIQLFCGFAWI